MGLSRLLCFVVAVLLPSLPAAHRALHAGDAGGALKANLDLPFDAAGEGDDGEEEAPEIITFFGQIYEGEGVVFCCDTSATMSEGSKLEQLQREVIKTISQFSDRVEFGIVFFDTRVVKFPAAGGPAESTPPAKMEATEMVLAQESIGNGSCYKRALLESLLIANQCRNSHRLIICIGDGVLSCGGQNIEHYEEDTLESVRTHNILNVHINTIGVGSGGQLNEAWLRRLAAENSGSYARVAD